jgi:23S rRNA (cytidine1920-2'-O)/16S rRNA (cytidine1409-2'-O)-methyltransferase
LSKRARLDVLLVQRGLVQSRESARAFIMAGQVRVNGIPVTKPGTPVADTVDVQIEAPEHPYVGRGGVKLAHALDVFGISVEGRTALDIGASTGGFSDVLRQRGARLVVALDVGHGQLDWKLRTDPRIIAIERVNARTLTADQLPRESWPVQIATLDVSFISLRLILPVLPPLLAGDADVVALVKPQFEAGRSEVGKGGIVRDETVHTRVIDEVTAAASALGLSRIGLTESPITGMDGNREFLIHLRK